MNRTELLHIEPLTSHAFAPYGRVLGEAFDPAGDLPGFSNPDTDFWHAHLFEPGEQGATEVLWVNYRSRAAITTLEVHRLTEQAIVPLTGEVIHIVALSHADGSVDSGTIKAFSIAPGKGICMRPGCWHASRVKEGQVTCLMLTRSSTTVELIDHLLQGHVMAESALEPIEPLTLGTPAL
ncbi:ureidoglycolate lyase [Pseudomonas sp. GV085]|uniref:ureidoglycolate lyase n=1 Tax=Pseudomonas sp. GV085 TaxID=2135756 RepID=UPI000D3D8EC6|nr:ureidoglycolate lyase [Pseudomonas sp. GV085]PTR29596.1 ureidoglycolate lyase [Pseudomonas sp. GV085]